MRILIFVLLALVPLSAGCADKAVRLDTWAEPMAMEGVPNLHRVDEGVYRSAQPSALGMRNLDAAGFRTVLNLRAWHTDEAEAEGTALLLTQVPMKTWSPREEEVVKALSIVMDPESRPVLVHCWHGADRTGTICALYRVVAQGWTKEAAIDEMENGGYGFHAVWFHLPKWIRAFDVEAVEGEFRAPLQAVE